MVALAAVFLIAQTWLFGPVPQPFPSAYPPCPKPSTACKATLGTWLPTFGDAAEPWRHAETTRVHETDAFVYEGKRLPYYLGEDGPSDGTIVRYGHAGPLGVHVVYDAARHAVFYEQHCCSAGDVVAASSVAPPPVPIVNRDLSELHTARGIRLGMSSTDVTRIYGPSGLLPVPMRQDVKMLAYTTWKPYKEVTSVGLGSPGTCGQFQNFYFWNDRLVLIQLGNGC
ncbi:MAG: hypothetical protein JO347_01355 [Candidatus Eremiobacteraeota bacterium]|nr:hypothetical protein [Candidatus Eremiobacteraeota bacterium]